MLTMPNTWRTSSASSAATIASPPVIVAIVVPSRSETRVVPAVDEKRLAGDPLGVVARQVADHAEQVGRGPGALDDARVDQPLERAVRDLPPGRLVGDRAGRDG